MLLGLHPNYIWRRRYLFSITPYILGSLNEEGDEANF
jgi:hypothetical protein